MLNILKDTKVPNSDYVVAEDHLNVSEIDLVLCNNIYNSEITIDKLKYINSIEMSKLPNLLLEKGDLLFNRTNSKELVGKTAIFELDGQYVYASYLIRLKLDTSKVNWLIFQTK